MYIHSTYDTNTQRHQHIPFYMCVHLYIFLFVSLVRFFLLIPFIFVILLYQRLWFWASYVPFWPVYAASRGIHEGLIKNHLKERVKKKMIEIEFFKYSLDSCLHIYTVVCCLHAVLLLFLALRSQTSIKMKRDVRFDMIVVNITNLK